MTESAQRLRRKIEGDQFYVNITFKVKYKAKILRQEVNLDGYTTVQNVILKKNRNIDKILSDFIREQPTFLNQVHFFYLKRDETIIKSIDKSLKVSQIGLRNEDEIIIIDDKEKKRQLDEQIKINTMRQKLLKLKDNQAITNLSDDFDHILSSYFRNRIEPNQINLLKEQMQEEKNKRKKILKGIFFILVIGLIILGICFVFIHLEKPKKAFTKDDLVIDIKYTPGMTYRY